MFIHISTSLGMFIIFLDEKTIVYFILYSNRNNKKQQHESIRYNK